MEAFALFRHVSRPWSGLQPNTTSKTATPKLTRWVTVSLGISAWKNALLKSSRIKCDATERALQLHSQMFSQDLNVVPAAAAVNDLVRGGSRWQLAVLGRLDDGNVIINRIDQWNIIVNRIDQRDVVINGIDDWDVLIDGRDQWDVVVDFRIGGKRH